MGHRVGEEVAHRVQLLFLHSVRFCKFLYGLLAISWTIALLRICLLVIR